MWSLELEEVDGFKGSRLPKHEPTRWRAGMVYRFSPSLSFSSFQLFLPSEAFHERRSSTLRRRQAFGGRWEVLATEDSFHLPHGLSMYNIEKCLLLNNKF